jgi:hypothetical protein
MSKKDKGKTFAQRAREIESRYKRAHFDPIEARDMESALEALMKEQEEAREKMGLVDTRNRIYSDEKTFNKKGTTYFDEANRLDAKRDSLMNLPDPTGRDQYMITDIPRMKESLLKHQEGFKYGGKIAYENGGPQSVPDFENPQVLNDFINRPSISPLMRIGTPQIGQPVTQGLEVDKLSNITANQSGLNQSTSGMNNQYLPSIISGASNIGSNLLLAALTKNNQKRITPSTASPQKINLEPQAERLRKQATTARNIATRNARIAGNTGQYLSNVGAAGAGINRGLGESLTDLYLGQEQFNTGAANQFGLANLASRNRAGILNTQLDQQMLQDRLGYIGGALGAVPGVMRDINMINADEETRALYEKMLPLMGRNYGYLGNIFGSVPISRKVRGV